MSRMQDKPERHAASSARLVNAGATDGIAQKQMPAPLRQRRHTLSDSGVMPPLANANRRVVGRTRGSGSDDDATPVRERPVPYRRVSGASPGAQRTIIKTAPFGRTNSLPTYPTEEPEGPSEDAFSKTTRAGFTLEEADAPPPPPPVAATRTYRDTGDGAGSPAGAGSASSTRQASPRRVYKAPTPSRSAAASPHSPASLRLAETPTVPPLAPTSSSPAAPTPSTPPPTSASAVPPLAPVSTPPPPAPVTAPVTPMQPSGPPPLAPQRGPAPGADDGRSGDGFSPRPGATWRTRTPATSRAPSDRRRDAEEPRMNASPPRAAPDQRRRPQSSRRPPTQSVQTARERAQKRRTAASVEPGRGGAATDGASYFPGAKKIDEDKVSVGSKIAIGLGLVTGAVTVVLLFRSLASIMNAPPAPSTGGSPSTAVATPAAATAATPADRARVAEAIHQQDMEFMDKMRASVIGNMRGA